MGNRARAVYSFASFQSGGGSHGASHGASHRASLASTSLAYLWFLAFVESLVPWYNFDTQTVTYSLPASSVRNCILKGTNARYNRCKDLEMKLHLGVVSLKTKIGKDRRKACEAANKKIKVTTQ